MIEHLLKQFSRDITLKGYTQKTQLAYYGSLVKFLNYYDSIKPQQITKDHIKDYLFHLIHHRKLSVSTLRQTTNAIRYFYSQTLQIPMIVENIPCPKNPKKLPGIFSVDEVFRIINSAENLKYKTILMIIYSSGLRIGEVVTLKIADIHRDIMRISVRQAKGRKDRYTILSSVCLSYLERY